MSDVFVPKLLGESKKSMRFRDKTPLHSGMKAVVFNESTQELDEVIDARFYWGNGQTCHCAVWIADSTYYGRGVGRASGYGFHHESAALSSALTDMGIKLGSFECSAAGGGAMEKALREVAKEMGYQDPHIVGFHR